MTKRVRRFSFWKTLIELLALEGLTCTFDIAVILLQQLKPNSLKLYKLFLHTTESHQEIDMVPNHRGTPYSPGVNARRHADGTCHWSTQIVLEGTRQDTHRESDLLQGISHSESSLTLCYRCNQETLLRIAAVFLLCAYYAVKI